MVIQKLSYKAAVLFEHENKFIWNISWKLRNTKPRLADVFLLFWVLDLLNCQLIYQLICKEKKTKKTYKQFLSLENKETRHHNEFPISKYIINDCLSLIAFKTGLELLRIGTATRMTNTFLHLSWLLIKRMIWNGSKPKASRGRYQKYFSSI